jgi:TolB-like protein/Tfp pilus assembly protein PilF
MGPVKSAVQGRAGLKKNPRPSAPAQQTGESSTPEQVRKQLEKIVQSRLFVRSERMCRFLRYSVEHALAGTGQDIKEFLVGVEVFDRAKDYDPRVDPIVRVEAHRLRSKLKTYYTTAGKSDPLFIEFPKGAYVPAFRLRRTSRQERTTGTDERAIAVLPFVNLSSDPEGAYLSDGLTEELILLLTRMQGLRVVAWESASKFRGREQDLPSIRSQLQVDAVLRGSVRRKAGRVRVTAQLIDTATGAYLWSEAFDRSPHDVLMIEQEIARAIVDTLQLALAPADPILPAAKEVNLECYNLCLKGRFYANTRTPDGLARSVFCYEQAIDADSGSAVAHAGLADAYSLLADYGLMHPNEAMPRAEAVANTALGLDPNSAEAYCSLAFIRSLFGWRWTEAEALYQRAIALNPGYSKARHWYSVDHLALLGRFEESAAQIQIARSLDPLSMIIHEGSAYLSMVRRNYEAALADLQQVAELDPTFYKAYSGMGRVLSLMKRYDESIVMFEKARVLMGGTPNLIGALGQTLALAGRREEAYECLEELNTLAKGRYVPSTCFGILYMGLGEIEKSLDCFETACERHECPIAGAGVHPVYDPVRGEPRFQAILRRMDLLP